MQIAKEKDSLVSENGKNLDKNIAKLSELNAELKFANDLYKASLLAAENTRLDSLKRQRFIAIISNPTIPEDEWQYWRHKRIFNNNFNYLCGFFYFNSF